MKTYMLLLELEILSVTVALFKILQCPNHLRLPFFFLF